MMKKLIIAFLILSCLSGCKKIAGPGGTSAIRGIVKGSTSELGESEVTQIICTSGMTLEHGDYWILNTSNSNKNYYIYYANPTWVSNANPNLQGRTGIMVVFNYGDSNIEIAQNTKQALQAISNSNFSVTIAGDVLTITDGGQLNVVDADDATTSFSIDVVNHGKPGNSTSSLSMANERVYLIYGENAYPSEDVRTDELGQYSFEGLQKGSYTVYVLSKVSNNPDVYVRVDENIALTEDESIVLAPNMNILY